MNVKRFVFLLLLAQTSCLCPHYETADKEVEAHQQVAELLKHFYFDPDYSIHNEITPVTESLIKLGRPALKYGALELLLSPDCDTRLRAICVLYEIVERDLGTRDFDRSADFRKEAEAKFHKIWLANGAYRSDDPEESRRVAYQKWAVWLAETDARI
jgi:hypothetical protein